LANRIAPPVAWAVRRQRQVRIELPLHVVFEQFRQEQNIEIAAVGRALQQSTHALEDLLVLVCRHAVLDETAPDLRPYIALDLLHQRPDAQRFG
jgi:hypothetical protein